MTVKNTPKTAVFILMLCSLIFIPPGPALAAGYTVDPGRPVSTTNYHSLEALRSGVTSWTSGDTITLFADDASLAAQFDFGAASVTINGGGFAITPQTLNSYRFAHGGAFSLNGANLSGFKYDGGPGGAIYSDGAVNIDGGQNSFTGNIASGATLARAQTTNPNDTLVLNSAPANGVVTWLNGGRENDIWNASSANWDTTTSGLGPSGKFLHGDAAVFNSSDSTLRTVQVQDGRAGQGLGVQIQAQGAYPAMTVDGGNWLFSGGAIESADGQVMQLQGGAVVTFNNETAAGVDTGSRTMRQRVAVPIGHSATIAAAYGASLYWTGYRLSGAAVYADGALTLGTEGGTGHLYFLGNSVNNTVSNAQGGAISGSTITLAGANTFTGNMTSGNISQGGAVYSSGAAALSGANTFTGNRTVSGNGIYSQGGALYGA